MFEEASKAGLIFLNYDYVYTVFFEESVILNILKNECGMCMSVMIKGTQLLCVETPTVYN